jgi:hypothetical protein
VCYVEIFNSCIICAANNVRAGINFIVQHYGRMEIPRVPRASPSAKYRALGKKLFPECCTRGRNALGEEGLPRVPDSEHVQYYLSTRIIRC